MELRNTAGMLSARSWEWRTNSGGVDGSMSRLPCAAYRNRTAEAMLGAEMATQ
jgi:hypothetical protein